MTIILLGADDTLRRSDDTFETEEVEEVDFKIRVSNPVYFIYRVCQWLFYASETL